jgi:membrane fusion protein, multidrug efflux system
MPVRAPCPSLLPLAGLLSACLALAGCGDQGRAASGPPAAPAAVVTTQVASVQPWSDTIAALGTVQARESVAVTAKVSETVERVHFESGQEVGAGAVLVTLSGDQQRAALQAAEAAAREAEQQYRRGSELVEQQLIARSLLDTQQATRDSARAQVAQVRANLSDRVIRAPFGGMLGIRQVSPGSLVTPGTVLATLDDISRVYVDFPVPEGQLAQLAVGQRLAGTSAAWPGETFEGIVSTIDARIDATTRAVVVRGDFPNPERRLRPGMLVQVTLERPRREALVLPEIAVVQVGRDTFVWRVREDDTVERANVELGERRAGRVEVVQGIADGDRIVVDGTGKLRPGMAITEGPAGGPQARPEGDAAPSQGG